MNAPVDPHPSAETLRAFGSGRLDEATAEAVVAHFGVCLSCRDKAASFSGDKFLGRLRAVHDRRRTVAPGQPLPAVLSATARPEAAQPTALAPLTIPPELHAHEQYEVLRELGRGGMGVVYLAKNRLMNRSEVLKVVNSQLLAHGDAAARFLREICAAARLNHPNIVTAYAAFQVGELLVFAMEYVEGEDLARVVNAHGPLPVVNACYYAQQVALGLQHAFEKGMVHRDVKPQNLILAHDSKKHIVKILDFGLARAAHEEEGPVRSPAEAKRKLTKMGAMLGTPDYVAPEQIADAASADIRADLYSLGCTLYFLLTGSRPFPAPNLYALLYAHQSVEARPVHELRPEVPAELAAVVARLMAKDPARRYQQPVEVAQALARFLKGGLRPLPPGALPAGNPADGTAGTLAATEGPTLSEGKATRNPGSGPPAGVPAPVLRQTVLEGSATMARGSSQQVPGRAQASGAKGAAPWPIWSGVGVTLLLTGAIGLWSAGVFDGPTPPRIARNAGTDPVPERPAVLPEKPKPAEAADPDDGPVLKKTPKDNAKRAGGDVSPDEPPPAAEILKDEEKQKAVAPAKAADDAKRAAKELADEIIQLTRLRDVGNKVQMEKWLASQAKTRLPAWREAAERDSLDAMCLLGQCLAEGIGAPRNEAEAARWFRKAAEQGSAFAQNNLGVMYVSGRGVPRDDLEAIEWFQKAAKQGSAAAQNNLGTLYNTGRGPLKDAAKAVEYYRLAASQGSATAQTNLGNMYDDGRGVVQDSNEAARLYRQAAEQGHPSAQNNLGNMYRDGRGVLKDLEEALNWYHKAAAQGNAAAQNNLGNLYATGVGVARNYPEAVKWFHKAAVQRNAAGQYNLGRMYQNGWGVQRDAEAALYWYRLACAGGSQEAARALQALGQK